MTLLRTPSRRGARSRLRTPAVSRPRARPAALAVACGLLLAACSSDPGHHAVDLPLPPPPTVSETPTAPPPQPDCGNPELSLKPPAAVPAPGSWPTDSTMQRIRDRGFLIAGIDQSSYPFGYRDPVDNRLKGFDIDLIREVARAIFGDPVDNRIQFRVLPNKDRDTAVADGRVDIAAMTMTVDCLRRQNVDFSDVYYVATQRVLIQKDADLPPPVREGLPGLAGYRVCAVNGSRSFGPIMDPKYGVVPVVGATWADCLVKLQKGEVEAVSTDENILFGLRALDPNHTEIVGEPVSLEPYAMPIAKQHTDFVRFVNAVLARLRNDGTWSALYGKYIAPTVDTPDPRPPAVTAWRDAP
ncbi:transporter substrate-binding domain-containing protein [Yinghuangia sp. ASG 101]|uniref:transporter substrate-binding domain-containing protein n=1 Tax=Yinghuangia sp. ASG 101 TaxID=2896848 RepID=UPI001E48E223|nr:transporter substrate-binding domain-containing protein [Yinghuangia sp. ASG 101]UGQ13732.1 transporter substrate-binding domain-containing protein [Yinghuangia sp. ASG 101]